MRRLVFVFAVAIGLALLSACGGSAQRDDAGSVQTRGRESVFSLRVGDCFDSASASSGRTSSVELVPCDEPHGAEVFFLTDHSGGLFPGEAALNAFGETACISVFRQYVGIDYDESEIYAFSMTPTLESWTQRNDREVICALRYLGDEQITGSLRGARR